MTLHIQPPVHLLQAEQVSSRRMRVTLIVLSRPAHLTNLTRFYQWTAAAYAQDHKSKLDSDIDVSLMPFRESAIITFTMKAYKKPDRHHPTFLRGKELHHSLWSYTPEPSTTKNALHAPSEGSDDQPGHIHPFVAR